MHEDTACEKVANAPETFLNVSVLSALPTIKTRESQGHPVIITKRETPTVS